ncbi:programmed cell death protein 2-like [Trichogramma pretiosum]|uniref:programmed cell death protein 2-like n=1 Tax=Trichogramma pretiosum TaxID=7493 RepID=UPI0006C9C5A6|nr:programmed cell death protein 2-like [Trichogramma pretiosum]XP_014234719.1 programmed cell death protein 2-like [Trichogramma pretiosum]
MSDIDIGFAQESESWQLESRFFPSKVGGKPSWLDLKNIPDSKKLACDHCQQPTIFLCQIYAPIEEDEKAYHRTIYVFICKNPICCKDNSNGNLKVLRSQLEQENEFYPPEDPVVESDWQPDLCVEKWSKICSLCGISATQQCSPHCKKVYCSRIHKLWDWKSGHKAACIAQKEQSVEQSLDQSLEDRFLFPQFEIVFEKEQYSEKDCSKESDEKDTEAEELKKFEELVKSGKVSLQSEKGVDEDLLKLAYCEDDEVLMKFKERTQNEPKQVVRYNRGGHPLFVSSSNQPSEIPNCELCNSERQFEFQIMPYLLTTLKIDSAFNCIHWGTIAIYTCKNSCKPNADYVSEYAWKQS